MAYIPRFFSLLKRAGFDGFILALGGMIALAYLFPQPGTATKPVSLSEITDYGISLVFLFYGMRLSLAELRKGLTNWRMHLVVQGVTFVVFPLLIVVYSAGRAYAARRYGSGACDEGTPVAVRFLYVAGLLTVAAAYIYWHKGDAESAGFAAGMAAGMLGGALFFALRQRLRRSDE